MSSGNTEIHKANDIQIAFFDVDGTLVDINTKVATPKMLDTLRALQKKRCQNLHRHRKSAR